MMYVPRIDVYVAHLFSDEGRQLIFLCSNKPPAKLWHLCTACTHYVGPGMVDGYTEPSFTLLVYECVSLAVCSAQQMSVVVLLGLP